MIKYLVKIIAVTCLVSGIAVNSYSTESGLIKWQDWNEKIFEDAKAGNKLVILDLEAVWCHWCHVMDEKTYSNTSVADFLNKNFITVKVDQDSRPDLSQRYEDYGWPAIIIFNSSGKELAKRSGYQEASKFLSLLKSCVSNPEMVEEDDNQPAVFSTSASLPAELLQELNQRHAARADRKLGGLNSSHKYLDEESMELYLTNAADGNQEEKEMAKLTLTANLKLIDPVWGGTYQYSTHSDWDHPHYEKIIPFQAANLRMYSLGFSYFKDPAYSKAAEDIYRYLKDFMRSPEGAFYTSQDADVIKGKHSEDFFNLNDEQRRKQGIPQIDKNIYSRENGLVIQALAEMYAYLGNKEALEHAVTAANWITQNRSLGEGGFRHGENDKGGPFLSDTLQMTKAYLMLYLTTADRKWMNLAQVSAKYIANHFIYRIDQQTVPGYIAGPHQAGGVFENPVRQIDENVIAARTFNLLWQYTGNQEFNSMAGNAMKFLSTKGIALQRKSSPGIILANKETSSAPFHVTVIGAKSNPKTLSLYVTALSMPSVYRRIELWDRVEGPLFNSDVTYPEISKPAAFLCTNKRCSLPLFNEQNLIETAQRFGKPTQ